MVGGPDGKYTTFDAESGQDTESGQPSSGAPDEDEWSEQPQLSPAGAEATENASHPSYGDIRLLSNCTAEEAAAEESAEEMEEEDDIEEDDG